MLSGKYLTKVQATFETSRAGEAAGSSLARKWTCARPRARATPPLGFPLRSVENYYFGGLLPLVVQPALAHPRMMLSVTSVAEQYQVGQSV